MSAAPCIWTTNPPRQRLTHVYFRRAFTLSGAPRRALIHLYARTNYHLRVNGVFVGYGPARSHNEFPEYDTYDIAAHLRKGANVIGVQVSHDGFATFHHPAHRGVFVAWGEVTGAGRERVSFSTASGWQCHLSKAVEPNPLPFSFAIGPIQIFDERKAPQGWDRPGAPGGVWRPPVIVSDALEGRLLPRSIPHLTQEEKSPLRLLGAWEHDTSEDMYAFSVPDPAFPGEDHRPERYTFAYGWLHSPRAQKVTVGNWWGDPALNGRILKRTRSQEYPGREDMTLDLRKGWNFLATYYRTVFGVWDMHLGIPQSAGITISAERGKRGKPAMMVAGPMDPERARPVLTRWARVDEEELRERLGRFRRTPLVRDSVTPSRGLAWTRFAKPIALAEGQTHDLRAAAGVDSSFVFDMGGITLGRVFVEFDAPRGTVIDIGYAEQLYNGRPHIYKSDMVQGGERHIAAGGPSRMETFAPRGFRYLHVAVRKHTRPVAVRRVGAVSQVYPYVKRGSFECSDPALNMLWAFGWNTLRLCSEDVYLDCPWRERTLYAGDLLPETATAMVTTGDLRLARRSLELFCQSQSPESGWIQGRAPAGRGGGSLSDFPLIVLVIAEWYCRLSGDTAFARRCYPVFRRMMASALKSRDRTGLFVTHRAFIMHGYRTPRGALCALNALVARAFGAWGSMLEMTGRKAEAAEARKVSRRTGTLVVRRFWDRKAGAFADALPPDNPQNLHTIPANSWPLMFCDVPRALHAGAVAEIERRLARHDHRNEPESISTYPAFYMLGGLYEVGAVGLAEESMRRVYSMMIERPTGTVWEHCHPDESLTHAWSTAPNYYLSTRALGVRLGFPDRTSLREVLIAPQSESLAWARGTVPHPCGDISVDWRVTGDRLELAYSAPAGVKVTVAPQGRLGRLRLRQSRFSSVRDSTH